MAIQTLEAILVELKHCLAMAAGFVVLIWLVHLLSVVFALDIHTYGVLPRDTTGLRGVLLGPFIHGSWQHLLSNTMPLLLLGTIMLYGNRNSRWWALAIIWQVSGLGVWFFARDSYHFGASGITHGLFYFLCLVGILRRDLRSVVLLMIAFYMYSTMLTSIFPRERGVSFEYHLFGALGGILSAVLFRDTDRITRKKYAWQTIDDSIEEDDPVIGDQWKL